MTNKTMLAPSVFAAELGELREQVAELEAKGVELLHFDVMDGQFVERIAFGADHLRSLRKMTSLPIEAHLMVERPEYCVESMLEAGADIVVIHAESTTRILSCLHKIRKAGAKAGIALNPATSEEVLRYVLDDLDKVIVMTVNPGEGGQHFLTQVMDKITRIREMVGDRDIDIEVDGSVDDQTIAVARDAGANVFVSGGYLFAGDIGGKIDALRGALTQ